MREDILNNLLREEDDLKQKIKENRKVINKMLKEAIKLLNEKGIYCRETPFNKLGIYDFETGENENKAYNILEKLKGGLKE